ncbi:MAG TPA: penicillin acylase family protein [Jiangellales bacterium]|nr:penicillin acylase family protein [Jiangellales bacterium]
MRRLVTVLSVVAGVLVVALVAGTALTVWSVRRPFPDYAGELVLDGLGAEVEVLRDEHGIPHVYADTAEDLFRAQGYVHAQDRFWQMDFRRHVTAGRLSELFGEDQVETDAFLRTLGWRRVAQQELPLLDPATRRYLQSYAQGVNDWLHDRSGGELGLAYTLLGLQGGDTAPADWTAVDSLAWLKAMAWDLRSNMIDEIDRALLAAVLPTERVEQLYPDYPYDRHAPIVADEDLAGPTAQGRAAADAEPTGPGAPRRRPDPEPPSAQLPSGALDALAAVRERVAAVPELLGSGPGVGSNAWVVDGSLTESGAPMVVNDTHLAPEAPSVWHQGGLHCREVGPRCPFDVAGFSFAGLPGVVIGHNQSIAWGFSNLAADVVDLYLEEVRGDSVLVDGERVPLERRTERIEVAGGEPVLATVRSSRHGPLLSDASAELRDVASAAPVPDEAPQPAEEGYAVALRWTALEPGTTADALFALNQATDWEGFRAAAALFEVPSQNMVYADVEGRIGYQAPGRIPVRASGDGRWPVPGWTSEYDWAGFVPFEALPSVDDPEEGVVVTANQAVTPPAYPFFIGSDQAYGYRAQRIRDLIEESGPLDAEGMVAIQMDTWNGNAEFLVPHLLRVPALGDYYRDGQDLLRDWDYRQEPDSAAAAYFNAVWSNLLRLTFHDELPDELWPSGDGRWFEVVRGLMERFDDPFWDDVTTETVRETRDTILRRAMEDARDDLTRRLGKDPAGWSWGRLHALELREGTFGDSGVGPVEALFNRGPYEVGGGKEVVRANGWDAGAGYEVDWVPSMRMVVDLGDLDASRWIDLTGISGHPFHRHYGDQTELWRTGATLPMRWDAGSVREEAVDRMVLVPSGSPPS